MLIKTNGFNIICVYVKTKQMVTFLNSGHNMSPFLLSGQDVASTTFLEC
jgi:hypothetical protein